MIWFGKIEGETLKKFSKNKISKKIFKKNFKIFSKKIFEKIVS